jgi:hypothetical protein
VKYSYKITYDIYKDMWNWRGALSDFRLGYGWNDNFDNVRDRKIAMQIVGLKKQAAEAILRPYLDVLKNDVNSRLNKFVRLTEQEFSNKFTDACLLLEKITGCSMASNEYTFLVTTFPRMTCFFDRHEIFMYCSIKGVWGMPVDGFLHEGLHHQFIHYWQQDNHSPVSRLSDIDFFNLKEALTVILDEELKPIITVPDCSNPNLAYLRDPLHAYWKEHHDFNKLVEYGLTLLG